MFFCRLHSHHEGSSLPNLLYQIKYYVHVCLKFHPYTIQTDFMMHIIEYRQLNLAKKF